MISVVALFYHLILPFITMQDDENDDDDNDDDDNYDDDDDDDDDDDEDDVRETNDGYLRLYFDV